MVSDVLGKSWQLLREHWIGFAGIALVVGAVYGLFAVAYDIVLTNTLGSIENLNDLDAIPEEDFLTLFWVATIGGLIVNVVVLVANAAMIVMSSNAHGGRGANVNDALKEVWARFWKLLGVVLLIVVLFVGGLVVASLLITLIGVLTGGVGFVLFLALFVALIWIVVRLTPLLAVVLLEDLGVTASIRRSLDLVVGHWWSVFGTLIVVGLIGSVTFIIAGLIPGTIGMFVGILAYAGLFAFQSVVVFYIYSQLKAETDFA